MSNMRRSSKKGCSSPSLETTTIITTNTTAETLNACGENLGQGKFQATHFLVDNPTLSGRSCSFLAVFACDVQVCVYEQRYPHTQVCAYERYPHALFSRHFLKHQPHVGGVVGTTEHPNIHEKSYLGKPRLPLPRLESLL